MITTGTGDGRATPAVAHRSAAAFAGASGEPSAAARTTPPARGDALPGSAVLKAAAGGTAGAVAGAAVGRALLGQTARLAYPSGNGAVTGADVESMPDAASAFDPASGTMLPGGPPMPPDRPNVVFVMTDDQTMEQLDRAMPYTDGRDDWVRFSNASLNVALCCPSRSNVLKGQFSHHTGVEYLEGWKLDDTSTIATWLDDAGYETGLFGKYLNKYRPESEGPYTPPGWDDWHVFRSGDGAYYDYDLEENGELNHFGSRPEEYSTDVLGAKAEQFIEKNAGGDDPFFLYFAPYASHAPYTPAPRHEGAFDGVDMPRSEAFNEEDMSDKGAWMQSRVKQDPEAMDEQRRDAWETALSADEAIEGLFETLEREGELDETVVVFMTDNGFNFGEHRWNSKVIPYDTSTQTQMLVRIPGVEGRTIDEPVQSVDVAATIADLANVTPGNPQDGRSMLPLVYGVSDDWRDGALLRFAGGNYYGESGGNEVEGYWGFRTPEFKLIEWENGDREFYDLTRDPDEVSSQLDNPEYAADVRRLDGQLEYWKQRAPQDPDTLPTLESELART